MKHFLALDDEPFALEDLEETLADALPNCKIHAFSSPSKALRFCRDQKIDVAFLDIELGSVNGIVFAKQLKDIQPQTHIIFVTSHDHYAVQAFQMHASGYLMKPVSAEGVARELTFLYGENAVRGKARVQTFGGFDIFVDGKALLFKRSKAKELLAYLVDRHGVSVTVNEICIALWENSVDDERKKSYFRTILADLRNTLKAAGIEDIVDRSFNRYAIVTNLLDCDSYRFMEGDAKAVNSYRHDYLPCYSWAEFSVAALDERLK